MEQIDTSSKPEFQVPLSIIPAKKKDDKSLEEMFDRMEIKVVGRENEE